MLCRTTQCYAGLHNTMQDYAMLCRITAVSDLSHGRHYISYVQIHSNHYALLIGVTQNMVVSLRDIM